MLRRTVKDLADLLARVLAKVCNYKCVINIRLLNFNRAVNVLMHKAEDKGLIGEDLLVRCILVQDLELEIKGGSVLGDMLIRKLYLAHLAV
jgi:hypothetical protein